MYLYRLWQCIKSKKYPQLDVDAKADFKAISTRWQAFQYQVPWVIISYTPILIIAAFCGYIEGRVYAIYNTIFAMLSMIVNISSLALTHTFGNIIA